MKKVFIVIVFCLVVLISSVNVFATNINDTGILACNGKYLCAENGGNSDLVSNRSVKSSWETFKIIDLGNNNVALQACNGRYVCAESAGNGNLIANRTSINSWETFNFVDLGNSSFALKACNGKYVCAENGGNSILIANRTSINLWETFKLSVQPNSQVDSNLVYTWQEISGEMSFVFGADGTFVYTNSINSTTSPLVYKGNYYTNNGMINITKCVNDRDGSLVNNFLENSFGSSAYRFLSDGRLVIGSYGVYSFKKFK
jgi:hypothetical protein